MLCCWTFWICRKAGEIDGFIEREGTLHLVAAGSDSDGGSEWHLCWWVETEELWDDFLHWFVLSSVSLTVTVSQLTCWKVTKKNKIITFVSALSMYALSMYALSVCSMCALHQLRSSFIFLYGIFIYILWNKLLNKLSMLHELAQKKMGLYNLFTHTYIF